ncbi:MAG TPA: phage baseplate assembly protein V [Flavisolibacter sp.]|nr:phage baseplate assembly protein V [Flavisolibacter sp.]
MAGSTLSVFQLTQTRIKVEGTEGDIIFSDLVISQQLADVNGFSFIWRQEEGDSSLPGHIAFYQKNLSKEVTINIHNNLNFKGIVCAINCNNQDALGVSYEMSGKGLFVKLDEVPECNSFYKKSLSQIFTSINSGRNIPLKLAPKNTKELFYTVQYNQTRFDFLTMLAARYGEWFYYTGTEMVLGKPGNETVMLTMEEDVYDVNITARLVKSPEVNAGFDAYKGEVINGQQTSNVKGSGLIAASLQAGIKAFGNNQTTTHFTNAPTTDLLKGLSDLNHQAAAASSVFITGTSYNSQLKLAGKIKLKDEKGRAAGEYIITEIQHSSITPDNYQNQFVAVPAENEVPPYTNPRLFPTCKAQPAFVVDNEDKDGLDRIKVRFPWQPASETTPWLPVLTPHAGKDKGFRFLPEVDEEVLIGFMDNNAEKPYVMGAVHTDKNKSGEDHTQNNVKVIGTKTGRRLEVNDEEGYLSLADNYTKKTPKNIVYQKRKGSETVMKIASHKDDSNFSNIVLTNEQSLEITITNGSSPIASIKLEKSGNKITIQAKGDIDITSDKDIKLKGKNIKVEASEELDMKGSAKGVKVKGSKVEVAADTNLNMKGTQTKVEGNAQLDLKGGAMANLQAGMVKIN